MCGGMRVEIGGILRHIGKRVVDLVIQVHWMLIVDIGHRYSCFLTEGHHPKAVESASRIHCNGQRVKVSIFIPSHSKEVAHRRFHGRFCFIVPVDADDREPPVAGRSHPDLLNGSRSLYLCHGKGFTGVDGRAGLPSIPAQIACRHGSIAVLQCVGIGRCHSSLPFSREVLGTD